MTAKPSATLLRKARHQVKQLDADVQALISPMLDRLEQAKQLGRPPSKTKPRRDALIAHTYDSLLRQYKTLTELAKQYGDAGDKLDQKALLAMRARLPKNEGDRFEVIAKQFHLSESAVKKIINTHLGKYRDDPFSIKLGVLKG